MRHRLADCPARRAATSTAGRRRGRRCGPAGSGIAAHQRDGKRRFTAAAGDGHRPGEDLHRRRWRPSRATSPSTSTAKDAPNTVNNFVFLSCDGFYDGLTFHRVVKTPTPFVIQGGDPRGNGTRRPRLHLRRRDQPQRSSHDAAGVLSMANAGPNTNGSQFFITLRAGARTSTAVHTRLRQGHRRHGRRQRASRVGDKIISVSIAGEVARTDPRRAVHAERRHPERRQHDHDRRPPAHRPAQVLKSPPERVIDPTRPTSPRSRPTTATSSSSWRPRTRRTPSTTSSTWRASATTMASTSTA